MKQIFNKIVQAVIPATDKLKHYYLWSMAFFLMIYVFDIIQWQFNYVVSDWWAYGVVVLTALWKELYHDWYLDKGTPELKDFIAGIAIASFYMFKTFI